MYRWITFAEIYITIQTNSLISFLRKIPFVKNLLSSSWFGKYKWKRLFSILGILLGFIKDAIGKNLIILLWTYLIPLVLFPDIVVSNCDYLILFLGTSCLVALVNGSTIFKSNVKDFTFLYHFMVDPKIYYKYKVMEETFFSCFMIFPILCFIMKDVFFVAAAVSIRTMCELLGNYICLVYYTKTERLPHIRVRQFLTIAIVFLTYTFVFSNFIPNIHFSMFGIISMAVGGAIISFLCWVYHNRFDRYREIAVSFGNQSMISLHISVRSIGEDERGLDEKPWQENKAYFEKFGHLPPEEYLHKAFWNRFGRVIRKDNRAQAVVSCGILALLGYFVRLGWLPLASEDLLVYSPILLSWTLSLSIVSKLTHMYFRNIDLHLLYNQMCSKNYVKNSMIRRYLHILMTDIAYMFVTLAGILIFLLTSGLVLEGSSIIKLVLISGAVLVIWDTYRLLVYYFIQPYTVDLVARNPVFSLLEVIEGLFGIVIMFVRYNLTMSLSVLLITAVIAIFMCFICSRFAYRFFKLRF